VHAKANLTKTGDDDDDDRHQDENGN